jgi:hypothetical protein
VYFGDGWDADYGKKARARLNVATRGASGWAAELIEETPGQYEIKQIAALDLDGDGRHEVIAAGNTYVSVFRRGAAGWSSRRLADADGFAVARVGGVGGGRGSRAAVRLVLPGATMRVIEP